jgi:hypothetical protein
MKRILSLITAALMATSAHAGGEEIILGTIFGIVLGRATAQEPQPQPQIIYGPPQVVYAPAPPPQVILTNPGIVCPQGLAPFYLQRVDRYGRVYYTFDGCR